MKNLAIFNRHGKSLEQIAKSMNIDFLALLDQLLEFDTSSLHLRKLT